jgi:prepilin-type N-terminal cleavage/methylation domain-containing protein
MKKFMNRTAKGFTLIELLVVIAIIAILSTIVLASLGTARQRARDTRAKSELSQMRAQAELFFTNGNNTFNDVCTTAKAEQGLSEMRESVEKNAGPVDCTDDEYAWAASAEIKGDGKTFCADSMGYAGFGTKEEQECVPLSE